MGAAFEIKKEIPIQIGLVLWSGRGVAVQHRGRAEARLPEPRRDTTLICLAQLGLASPDLILSSAFAAGRHQRWDLAEHPLPPGRVPAH
jgi:hypothetical protein